MNVDNRKLFANRDARRQLAEMGGIMASSPELLGEARKFANGGTIGGVSVEYYGVPFTVMPDGTVRNDVSGQILDPNNANNRVLIEELQMSANGKRVREVPGDLTVREVPGYLDTQAEVSPLNSRRNLDLIAALNESARGAEFADWLNSVGQKGIDAAAAVFRKTGAAGMQLDAELGMAMSMAAASLGFPEKAAEWRKNARDEMNYATDMQVGRIDVLGRPQGDAQFSVPDSARRMYDLAQVERTLAAAGPDSALLAEGAPVERLNDIPASIIQSRITPPPSAMTDIPTSMALPGETTGPVILGPDSAGPQAVAPGRLPYIDVSTGVPLTAQGIEAQLFRDRLGLAEEGYVTPEIPDRFPGEDTRRAEQEAELEALRARMLADSERAQMAGYEETKAANQAAAEMERLAKTSADEAVAAREAAGITDSRNSIGAAITEGRPEDARRIAEEARTAGVGEPAAATPAVDLGAIEEAANNPDLTPGQRAGAVSSQVLDDLGVSNAAGMTAKERVAAYESMFKEMLGEKDEDLQKEMWMNMAMIGFSIAAGESPNALQNIAQGLLSGTKMMREDKATRQAREDKIRMMAISEGISDERAAQKYAQDLELARIRTKEYGARTDPLTAVYRLAGEMYNNGAGDYATYNEALTAARKQIETDYGITLPGSAVSAPPPAAAGGGGLPTVSTQAEYDALPPGAQFIQNGQTRRKPAA